MCVKTFGTEQKNWTIVWCYYDLEKWKEIDAVHNSELCILCPELSSVLSAFCGALTNSSSLNCWAVCDMMFIKDINAIARLGVKVCCSYSLRVIWLCYTGYEWILYFLGRLKTNCEHYKLNCSLQMLKNSCRILILGSWC